MNRLNNNNKGNCIPENLGRHKKDIPVEGERVTNLKFMAKKMFCRKCYHALSLCDIQGETVQGLGSIFDVQCSKCNSLTKVPSNEKYVNPTTNRTLFAINSKVALGKFILFINQSENI